VRGTFVKVLSELAEKDPRIVLLTGDLGYTVLEPFRDRFPKRFYNVGVAEQNMVGLATGIAEAGMIPFCYSIGTFASLRPFEFIRNGPVLHHLPVRVVGLGAGFEYGTAGPTHYSLEDIGVMRTQPGLNIVAPADFEQTATAVRATWDLPGPVYYRLGKDDKSVLPGLKGRFELGRANSVRNGDDLLIIACGPISFDVVAAADELAKIDIDAAVTVVASVSPVPEHDLVEILGRHRVALTVETHSITGGLGSLVAEVIAENGLGTRLVRLGVRTGTEGRSGSPAHMHARHGLDRAGIVRAAKGLLAGARGQVG
jgi:transketolase